MGEIKDREAFVIDSKNLGFGVPVIPFYKNVNKWNLHMKTVVKHTVVRQQLKVWPGQLVIYDDGKYERK